MKKELKLFGILLVSSLILGACSNQKKGEKTSNESEKNKFGIVSQDEKISRKVTIIKLRQKRCLNFQCRFSF